MYIRDGKDDREIDCAWLKKKPTKLAKRCEKDIFKTTCRDTCSFVNDSCAKHCRRNGHLIVGRHSEMRQGMFWVLSGATRGKSRQV